MEVEYVSEKPDLGDANGFIDPLMEDFQSFLINSYF